MEFFIREYPNTLAIVGVQGGVECPVPIIAPELAAIMEELRAAWRAVEDLQYSWGEF